MNDEASTPVVEVRDLVTHYGEREILRGINITVQRGEVMVIMGAADRVKVRCSAICWGCNNPPRVRSVCWGATSPR